MEEQNTRHFRFEGFTLDTRARELKDPGGAVVPLNARAFDALCLLLLHRDRVVAKDELLESVWAGRVVEENTLTQAISGLRRALGSGAGDHRFIVTVQGRGYRFVADVETGEPGLPPQRRADDSMEQANTVGVELRAEESLPASLQAEPRKASAASEGFHHRWQLGGVLVAASIALGVGLWLRPANPSANPSAAASTPRQIAPVTLAVLPFRSLSVGARDELLELGLADTLITRLSRSNGLQVRSLESSTRSGNPQDDARQAGRALGASFVVEGTTQVIGKIVRVNARLIRVAEGNTVWAETFDAPLTRVFTLQDRIADAVTSALALAPAPDGHAQSPCEGSDAVAYRAYLRGYYQLSRPDPRRMTDALAAFREALDRDPTCVRAWVGTANAYRALVMTGDRDPRETFPLAQAAVARALRIDPDSADAHTAKGFIEFWYEWDWPRAESSMRRAIALNPNLAEAHIALAHLLNNIGRPGEAVPHARQAVALDPLSPIINSLASSFLRGGGHAEEAERHLAKTLELEPDAWVALRIRGGRAMARGDFPQAMQDLQRAVEISGGHSSTLAGVARVHMRAGNRAGAERVLAELEARRATGYVPASSLAVAAAALGDTERVLDLLEQGYRERDVRMSFLRIDNWDAVRDTPRFQALLRRMRLADGEDKAAPDLVLPPQRQ